MHKKIIDDTREVNDGPLLRDMWYMSVSHMENATLFVRTLHHANSHLRTTVCLSCHSLSVTRVNFRTFSAFSFFSLSNPCVRSPQLHLYLHEWYFFFKYVDEIMFIWHQLFHLLTLPSRTTGCIPIFGWARLAEVFSFLCSILSTVVCVLSVHCIVCPSLI